MNQYGIPEVFESEAQGIVKDVYEDIKFVLKVPIVNFIFRALANYPEFLTYAWQQVRPNMLTINMELAASQLRFPTISTIIPTYDFQKDYHPQTLQHIKNVVSTFQYVNPKLLLIASAWSESLGNRPVVPQKKNLGQIQPGVSPNWAHIELIHIPMSPYYIKKLLLDIAQEHQSYDVSSDFRALANYPRFLEVTWHFLKSYIETDEYTLIKSTLLKEAVSIVHQEMPFPVTINGHQLEKIYSPAQIAGIMGLVSLFQNFLPGLMVENEFIRKVMM